MLIIKNDQSNVPTLAEEVKKIRRINTSLYQSMKDFHRMAYEQVWSNPNYSPSEIIGEFGNEAVALFQLSSGIQQILKNADPEYMVLNPNEMYTIIPNQDGTVSVELKPIIENPAIPTEIGY